MSSIRKSAGLPNITGEFWGEMGTSNRVDIWQSAGGNSGCFCSAPQTYRNYAVIASPLQYEGDGVTTLQFQASRSSSIYGSSSTVTPKSTSCRLILKY